MDAMNQVQQLMVQLSENCSGEDRVKLASMLLNPSSAESGTAKKKGTKKKSQKKGKKRKAPSDPQQQEEDQADMPPPESSPRKSAKQASPKKKSNKSEKKEAAEAQAVPQKSEAEILAEKRTLTPEQQREFLVMKRPPSAYTCFVSMLQKKENPDRYVLPERTLRAWDEYLAEARQNDEKPARGNSRKTAQFWRDLSDAEKEPVRQVAHRIAQSNVYTAPMPALQYMCTRMKTVRRRLAKQNPDLVKNHKEWKKLCTKLFVRMCLYPELPCDTGITYAKLCKLRDANHRASLAAKKSQFSRTVHENTPMRPWTAFCKENGMRDMPALGERWKAMTDAEKQPYVEEAATVTKYRTEKRTEKARAEAQAAQAAQAGYGQ